MTVIAERDVYRLVMRSKLPGAERFEEWVVGEVLPSIRKTGGYGGAPMDLNDPATLRTALLTYTEKVIALEATIERNAPAVEFAHTVRNMEESVDMSRMARVIGWGRNRLFETLRADGILMANNLPYQAYLDRGYFRVIEGTRERTDGSQSPTFTTRVTGKGQVFLQRRYAAKAA
jgi:phage antirepressor YoqD-like protein